MAIFERVNESGRVIERIDAGEHPYENRRLHAAALAGNLGWRLVGPPPEEPPSAPVVQPPVEAPEQAPEAPHTAPEPETEPELVARTSKPSKTKATPNATEE